MNGAASAAELLAEAARAGVKLTPLPGDRLKVRGPAPLSEQLLERLRAAKPQLLRALSGQLEGITGGPDLGFEDWKAHFNERAAVREFCGNLPRQEAEELAWDDMLIEWHRLHPMRVRSDLCAGCGNPLRQTAALGLSDGNAIHFDTLSCIARYGEHWRTVATQSLRVIGIERKTLTG